MNETAFKSKLRALLKPRVQHIQSMASLASNGTPDIYISDRRDCWLEIKVDEKTKGAIKPKLSALQSFWLDHRHDEGRNVMVIVGTSTKEAILYKNKNWNSHSGERRPLTELIEEILQEVN
jgi:hypothetical protein